MPNLDLASINCGYITEAFYLIKKLETSTNHEYYTLSNCANHKLRKAWRNFQLIAVPRA